LRGRGSLALRLIVILASMLWFYLSTPKLLNSLLVLLKAGDVARESELYLEVLSIALGLIVGVTRYESLPLVISVVYVVLALVSNTNEVAFTVYTVLGSILLSTLLHASKYTSTGSHKNLIPRRSETGILSLFLLIMPIAVSSYLIYKVIEVAPGKLLEIAAKAPLTVREFYVEVLTTKAGFALTVSVVAALAIWLLKGILEMYFNVLGGFKGALNHGVEPRIYLARSSRGESDEDKNFVLSVQLVFSIVTYPVMVTLMGLLWRVLGVPLKTIPSWLSWLYLASLYLASLILSMLPARLFKPKRLTMDIGTMDLKNLGRRLTLASAIACGGIALTVLLALLYGLEPSTIFKSFILGNKTSYRDPMGEVVEGKLEYFKVTYESYLSSIEEILKTLIGILWGR